MQKQFECLLAWKDFYAMNNQWKQYHSVCEQIETFWK